MNLVINARDAMPTGGTLTIATANVLLDQQPDEFVELSITDTGIGMDAETQARVFEPFFTTKTRDKGTGLGLSTVYGIVKQSGGSVSVSSAVGHGSTFRVYFPRTQGAAQVLPPVQVRSSPGNETVLVVEDEPAVRALVKRALEKSGYLVLTAGDGEEALQVSAAYQGTIHLLVTDVVMPKLGGPGLASRLLLSRPVTRVLYLSGYAHGLLTEGANFVAKPFTPETLTARVREVLDA
jgi:CheY-like chemotaxis protein